ncbi:sensor histidine kinase LiaS [Kordia sp. SMS9]|uniref:tetratricopeptide repeat-containing sensor histidine kinase n=1 Tax=Kordia sp. SMS9 TaxID=2282170 RepID=UPI000E0DF52C|nr:tetratricopeptide repeat-containing sensor histidine kinase [Kordia sp. SMS9]AXG68134.1 sensor histidine kinase LiaS [Kordia sp. SMS9]
MKLRILTFFLLLSTLLVAQNGEVSSEEAIVLFEKYEQQSEDFNQKREFDSLQIYAEKLDKLLPKLQDSSYHYRTDLIRGSLFIRNTESDKAMNILLKATEFFKRQKDYKNYYRGRYKIGICYYYVNRREETKNIMLEVFENKQFVGEDVATSALANIGAVNIELGMQQKNKELLYDAISKLSKAISINRTQKKYTKLASNYSLLAESYNQLKEPTQALKLLDSAIYFSQKDQNTAQEGFALIKKGKLFSDKKQYVEARNMFDKAIKNYKKAKDNSGLLYGFLEKKRLLMLEENYEAASKLGDSIYNLTIQNYNERFADGISEMETKYKTAEKEREILEQRADIAEKGLLLQKRQYQIYGALALALLILILGYVVYNQQKLKNRQLIKENKLKVALKEIETQNKLQEQRLRISRDLHDNIGAQLSFIISSIDNLKYASKDTSTEFKDKLSYISEFTSATIDQLRDTIWAMNKDEISLTDLQSRTLAFIEKAKVAKQAVKFTFTNEVNSNIQFTAIEGMHLFRVIQEAINNSLKYANAKLVSVNFQEANTQLVISVKDDGDGFEKETVQLGNGLYNMQKRMDEINAYIDINSKPGNGTEIVVKYSI